MKLPTKGENEFYIAANRIVTIFSIMDNGKAVGSEVRLSNDRMYHTSMLMEDVEALRLKELRSIYQTPDYNP